MNKKRLITVIVAAVVFVALAVTCVVLLMRNSDKSVSGTVNGTVGVNSIEKPENLGDLTFGITVSQYSSTVAGGSVVAVKNGETMTLPGSETVEAASLYIMRSRADENYDVILSNEENKIVYEQDLPVTMEWNMTDVLSGVEWEDTDFAGKEVETNYSCIYTDSCAGQFYTSKVGLKYTDGDGYTFYYIYRPIISVTYKSQEAS